MHTLDPGKFPRLMEAVGRDVFSNLLRAICLELENASIDLSRAVSHQNFKKVSDISHSLKACSQAIGLDHLAAHAEAFEALAMSGNAAQLSNFYRGVEPVLRDALEATTDLLKELGKASSNHSG